MSTWSIEELKNIIRKIEFNKTEPELLTNLVSKAMRAGEGERERLKQINKKSYELFRLLDSGDTFYQIVSNKETIEKLKKIPLGAVDGSFQPVGGLGGRWYVMIGIAQMIAEKGFTLNPIIDVDGIIEPLNASDEGVIYELSEILMMLGEMLGVRRVANRLGSRDESYILIDGPVIDPPLYANEKYVEDRVNTLRFCYTQNIHVIGFVKRIRGSHFLNYLRKKQILEGKFEYFTNDLDLLSSVMFNAIKNRASPIYTHPLNYEEGYTSEDKTALTYKTYKMYKDRGLNIYYTYYKPSARSKIFRIEYALFENLSEQEIKERFNRIMSLLNQVWTLPGLDEPLPIIIAHNKCNIRRGAAETIYYEIMTRALSEGNLHLWLESLTESFV
jgi:hypothetical protein